jgi:hypothetical protein
MNARSALGCAAGSEQASWSERPDWSEWSDQRSRGELVGLRTTVGPCVIGGASGRDLFLHRSLR